MSKYRFDQIAINSTAKKKPTEEDKYHYIGLEHIDSQNLIVSRWGSEIAPKGEKLLMKKGDVLFGKRRAYQKKVAIAPFDGIFSAHGMVLRPNEEVVDKDFFPMFISSDYFLDAAIAISVGSLSPTINWKDLAKLEFDLPPMEEQRKLAEVLWSINDTLQAYQNLLTQTDALVQAQFVEMFGDPIENTKKWEKHPLSELCEVITGNTPARTHPEYYGDYIEWIKTDNITSDSVNLSRATESLSEKGATVGRIAPPCSILMTCIAGSLNTIGNIGITDRIVSFNQQINALVPYETNVWFLYQLLKMIRPQIHTATNKALKCILTKGNLSAIEIIAPDKNLQQSFAMLIQQANASKATLQNTITSLQATKRSILERALGTGRKE